MCLKPDNIVFSYKYIHVHVPWRGEGVWCAGTKFVTAGLICLGGSGLANTVRALVPRPLTDVPLWVDEASNGMTGEELVSPLTVTI